MTRLFHTVIPVPECCKSQMKYIGNLELHVVAYQCCTCFKQVHVRATFTEDAKSDQPEQSVLNEMDAQE